MNRVITILFKSWYVYLFFRIYFNSKANVWSEMCNLTMFGCDFVHWNTLGWDVGEDFGLNTHRIASEIRQCLKNNPWIGNAPPDSNQRDEVSSHLCTSNTFSISLQRTYYIERSHRSNPYSINELASARKHCIVALLTLYHFITLQPHIFPLGNANLEFIHLNSFKKSLYFQPYEQKVQKFIIGYTK